MIFERKTPYSEFNFNYLVNIELCDSFEYKFYAEKVVRRCNFYYFC